MVAPTVRTIATPPIQNAVQRILPLRRRAYQAVAPAVADPRPDLATTVAATLSFATGISRYPRAATLYADRIGPRGVGIGLPAWLTQDWVSPNLTLTKAAGAGVVGTNVISIMAQDATGRTVVDQFLLTVS